MIGKRIALMVAAGAIMVSLSACTAQPKLDTAEARADAVSAAFDDLADAMEARDTDAIEQFVCEDHELIDVPGQVTDGERRLAIAVRSIREFEMHDTTYIDTDPDAEFHIARMEEPTLDDADEAVEVMAIVRVDDRDTCLWVLGNTLLTLMAP